MMTIIQRDGPLRVNDQYIPSRYDETIHDMMTLELKALTVKSHSSYYEQVVRKSPAADLLRRRRGHSAVEA
ncbi:hypothetical protein HYQ44_018943 [Verticillium longisporum]|nr:hypothetical protein HYQ44_018943 [Verticillium longisporum]